MCLVFSLNNIQGVKKILKYSDTLAHVKTLFKSALLHVCSIHNPVCLHRGNIFFFIAEHLNVSKFEHSSQFENQREGRYQP